MNRTLAIISTLAILSLPAVAFAQGPPCDGNGPRAGRGGGPGGGHHGPNPEKLAERAQKAGVDDATIDKIKGVVKASEKGIKDLQGEKREARKTLHELMGADNPNTQKVLQQVELLGHIRTELQKKRVGMQLEIRKLVTADQWKTMHPKRGEGRRGKGMRGKRGEGKGMGRGMGR
jgi:Spy/CpxP family protein refolding chaperone